MWNQISLLFVLAVLEVTCISNHPVLIVVSFDGLGYQLLRKENPPNLRWLRKEGVSVEFMHNVFSTQTSTNHHSMATGLYSESHGIVGNALYDPKYGREITRDEGEDFWRYNDDIVPIWMLNELAGEGRHSGGVGWPGMHLSLAGNYSPRYALQELKGTQDMKERVDLGLSWLTHDSHPANLLLFFFDRPDGLVHAFGPNSPEAKRGVAEVDSVAGHLLEQLRRRNIFHRVNLIFLSDHGLVEFKQNCIVELKDIIPQKYPYQTYGWGVVMQLRALQEEHIEPIYSLLEKAAKTANFSVYRKEEIPKRWHYTNSRRILPILLVADEGYGFHATAFDEWNRAFNLTPSPTRVYGSHGYDNALKSMYPYFIAHGPAFRNGGYVGTSFNNVDIFSLMCHILGLKPPPNNGTLQVVAELLHPAPLNTSVKVVLILTGVCFTLCLVGWAAVAIRKKIRSEAASATAV